MDPEVGTGGVHGPARGVHQAATGAVHRRLSDDLLDANATRDELVQKVEARGLSADAHTCARAHRFRLPRAYICMFAHDAYTYAAAYTAAASKHAMFQVVAMRRVSFLPDCLSPYRCTRQGFHLSMDFMHAIVCYHAYQPTHTT